ncbi:unnamed protein product, partial [Boreogadus saida]
ASAAGSEPLAQSRRPEVHLVCSSLTALSHCIHQGDNVPQVGYKSGRPIGVKVV